MNTDLKLIYIHEFGESWDGEFVYEFLFSDKTVDVDGEFWDAMPAAGKPTPPPAKFIKLVGQLKSEYLFDVLQKSNTHRMWDGVDGAIPLGIENIEDYDEYPEKRMFFHYGLLKANVDKTLYENDLALKYIKHEEQNN